MILYDVIVVGSGPSGTMAAKTCSENGLRVLLIEKKILPRYKVCGGALTKKAIDLISPLDELEIKYKSFGARLFPPGSIDYIECKFENPAFILTFRDSLDHLLVKRAEKSGVEIHENERVTNVNVGNDSVIVKTDKSKYSGKIIIGADGVNSTVARKTGLMLKDDSKKFAVCIETEIELTDREIKQFIDDDELIYIYFMENRGYGWVFPKGNIVSIGIGMWKPLSVNPTDVFNQFIDFLSEKREVNLHPMIEKKYPYTCPLGGVSRNIFRDRVLLVGDAAGFVDPLLGEGIYYSLISGIIAGDVSSESINCNNYSMEQLSLYEKKCNKSFNNDLKCALKFSNLIYRYLGIFFYLMRADPVLFKRFVLTVKGDLTYKEYFKFVVMRFPFTLIKLIQHHIKK